MVFFPAIWWLFPAAALAFILLSFMLTRRGKLESESVRKTLVWAGVMLGFFSLSLPLFEQPAFNHPLIQYGLGLLLFILGLIGRIYPMMYLRRIGTTTTLKEVDKLADTGPYAWVRHPQYIAGFIFLLGWFLIWGAWYALGFIPIIAGVIFAQALIEEKYILEKKFGEKYTDYCKRVGMLLPRLSGNDPMRITVAFLGIYAGLIATQHGIFEILQGRRAPGGLMFNAIGPPCQPEAVWHACFPAITLIPDLLVTGIAAVLAGLGMAIWATVYARHKRGGLVLGMLSVLALLVGGGFVPVFIGMVAAATSRGLAHPPSVPRFAFLAAVWPWPLILLALWLPGSWLLGHFFSTAVLSASGFLFIVFDLGLPVLAAVSSLARTE